MSTDRAKARWWHRLEFTMVIGLAIVATVGFVWSEAHNRRPPFIETRPR